jgi:hypothetical protein
MMLEHKDISCSKRLVACFRDWARANANFLRTTIAIAFTSFEAIAKA